MIGPQLPKRPLSSNHEDEFEEPPKKRRKVVEKQVAKDENCDILTYSKLLSMMKESSGGGDIRNLAIVNPKMHVRNLYRYKKPNYKYLSETYKYFNEHCNDKNKYSINYKDARCNLALTKVLLQDDFDLTFDMPLNHLCPPVTQRLNYILWIQDLLHLIDNNNDNNNNNSYFGFDIGTGSSCIFPLLGVKIGQFCNEKWKFIASDIDSESIKYAMLNVSNNKLNDFIEIKKQSNCQNIFENIIDLSDNNQIYHFTVCNPPFFDNLQETGLNNKRANPATKSELVFNASSNTFNSNLNNDEFDMFDCNNNNNSGEIGFLSCMVDEIINFKLFEKFYWFTSMLGKKSSLKPIISMIKRKLNNSKFKCDYKVAIKTSEFFQGNQTRWGVAWTYHHKIINSLLKPKNKDNQNTICARINDELKQDIPDKSLFTFTVDWNHIEKVDIASIVCKYIKEFGISVNENEKHQATWIKCNLLEKNGFTFVVKWNRIENDTQMHFEILFEKGDDAMFGIFCEWIQAKLKSEAV